MDEKRIEELAHGIFGYRADRPLTPEEVYFTMQARKAILRAINESLEETAVRVDNSAMVGYECARVIRAAKIPA